MGGFDRLPGHQLKFWEFKPVIAPPRPIFPTAQVVSDAMDKILGAVQYSSPYERQKRGFEMAQINNQMQLMPMQNELQRAQMEQQMKFLHGGNGAMQNMKYSPGHGWIPMNDLEIQRDTKLKRENSIIQQEANDHNDLIKRAHESGLWNEQPQASQEQLSAPPALLTRPIEDNALQQPDLDVLKKALDPNYDPNNDEEGAA